MRCSSSDEALALITARIRQWLGLAEESLVDSAIHSAIRRRMAGCSVSSVTDYLPFLEQEQEMALLLDEVVIPETWFARDEKPFTALVDAVRGHLLAAAGERPLHLLSAPCSTGEEPYSMAIALIEGGVAPSLFRIDAVDICHRSLAQAREGSYGSHSFRGDMPERWIIRHFEPTPEGYRVRPEIRQQVRFRQGNLLELDACCETALYDVIFCRNLLIYLEDRYRRTLLEELHRRLVPGGLLVVGHSEAPRIPRELFREWGAPGCFAFARRRPEESEPPVVPSPPRRARRRRRRHSGRGGSASGGRPCGTRRAPPPGACAPRPGAGGRRGLREKGPWRRDNCPGPCGCGPSPA